MKRWPDILEHQRVRGVLKRAIEGDRLHHAYLFTGPPGVGKFTVAHALAAVLNCEKRPDDSFAADCGQCSTCRRIASRQHPDVLFVEPPNKVIKIEQIRQVEKASISAPYEGRFRVVLIDDAHKMTEEAANALLKTLEEPPDRMILIVVTDQPHRLLDTIISRCQRMRFGALSPQTVARALGEFDEEADETTLRVAAGYGEGSLGRSLAILKSGMLDERRPFLQSLFALDNNSPRQWLDLADELSDSTEELEHRLEVLTVYLRDLLLYRRAAPERIVNDDLSDLISEHSPRFSTQALLNTLEVTMSARRLLDRHVNSTLLTEDLLDRLGDPGGRALLAPS